MRLLIWALLLAGLISTSVLAVYYQKQADALRQQLAVAPQPAQESRPPIESRKAAAGTSAPAQNSLKATSVTPAASQASGQDGRIRELETMLEKKDAIIFLLQQSATNSTSEPTRAPRRTQAWLEDLKQSNPQQYEAITNRRAQIRQDIASSFAEKSEYLQASDTSAMTEDERAQYQHMTDLLNETWRLSEQLQSDSPTDDRREVMQTLHQNIHELEPMLSAKRSREWYNLGLQLGYQEADAKAFGDYLNKVIDLTSLQSMFRNRRGNTDNPPPPR